MAFSQDPYLADAPNAPEARTPFAEQLSRLGPDRLLVVLGGLAALVFGTLVLVLHLAGESGLRPADGFTTRGGAVFAFAVALAFGALLLLAFAMMEARPTEGAILALAFSVVLLAFGSVPGLIGGILGLVGSVVGLMKHVKLG